MAFLTWLETFDVDSRHPDVAPVAEDGDGLIISPSEKIFLWTGGKHLVLVDAPFMALGSGAKVAMGAMAAGATAERAVRIACDYDIYTGGRIITLRVDADSSPQTRSIAQ